MFILTTLLLGFTPPVQEPVTPSAIDRVTVYQGSALVERVFEVEVAEAGATSVVIGPLPMAADPASVQARLDQGPVVIQGLELRQRTGELDGTQRTVLNERLQDLQRQLRDLDSEERSVEAGEKLVDAVLAAVRRGGIEALGAQGLDGMMPFLTSRTREIEEQRISVERRRADLAAKVEDLQRQLGGHGVGAQPYREARVEMFFERPGPATLRLSYLCRGASWKPVYDVRLDPMLHQAQVGLVGRVQQNTGEDWEQVQVLLSTSQPSIGLDPPTLPRRWAGLAEPLRRMRSAYDAPAAAADGADLRELGYSGYAEASTVEEPTLANAPEVVVQDYGLAQQFRLPERVNLTSDQGAKSYRLVNIPLEVRPERYVVPSLSTRCFLRAEVTSASDAPLLPGSAMVFLGPDYLGESSFPLMRPGDSTMLNLGVDPNLAVKWESVLEERDDPSFLSDIVRVNRVWELQLALSRAAREPITVLIEDAVPVSQDDRVKIKPLRMSAGALESEQDLTDRKERGIWRWRLQLQPGEEKRLTIGFTMSFDQDLQPQMIEG